MRRSPNYWQHACHALSQQDAVMATLIQQFQGKLYSNSSAFEVLCRSIVGQQISLKAADSIWQRLEAKLPEISPQAVAKKRRDAMSRCGLSANKVNYLKNIAAFFLNENVTDDYWQQNADFIRERLISIKGIGNWTYEMFAIFYLQDPDILPVKDLALLNAIHKLYNAGEPMSIDEVTALGETWAPWRTVATWYLWRSIDADPVVY